MPDTTRAETTNGMVRIQLTRAAWQYSPQTPLGARGGFGAVYAGEDESGAPVAVKRLHLKNLPAPPRELRIAQELIGREFMHVLPFLDYGYDAGAKAFFIVMERAEGSLQDVLAVEGKMSEGRAVSILSDIVAGLEELPDLVHRDLKPGNVLRHGGCWKLADFGISKVVEEATSTATLREYLSFAYAAPEQWRLDQPTKATDLYALGCIGYVLISGSPPFLGPAAEDYCRQHTQEAPPALQASGGLRQLLYSCLNKLPGARPAITSVRAQLERIAKKGKDSEASPLADAGAEVAAALVLDQSRALVESRALNDRRELANVAIENLRALLEDLAGQIEAEAPVAQRMGDFKSLADISGIRLGAGQLYYYVPFPFVGANAFEQSKWNVVVGAKIGIQQESPRYPGRSANLWYADLEGKSTFRWWEVPYMTHPLRTHRDTIDPFGFDNRGSLGDADLAAAPIHAAYQLAAKPVPVDLEFQEKFFERWKGRLALAARNGLPMPTTLPE